MARCDRCGGGLRAGRAALAVRDRAGGRGWRGLLEVLGIGGVWRLSVAAQRSRRLRAEK